MATEIRSQHIEGMAAPRIPASDKFQRQVAAVLSIDRESVRQCTHDLTNTLAHQARRRRVVRESFSMNWPDFIGELLYGWGAMRDDDGVWWLPNGVAVSSAPQPWNTRVTETGWHRWALPGVDGITRGRLQDPGAPWVVCSPDGRWFWCTKGRMLPRHWQTLFEMAGDHAQSRRVRGGWFKADAATVTGGAA